jgi:hypothetical protein
MDGIHLAQEKFPFSVDVGIGERLLGYLGFRLDVSDELFLMDEVPIQNVEDLRLWFPRCRRDVDRMSVGQGTEDLNAEPDGCAEFDDFNCVGCFPDSAGTAVQGRNRTREAAEAEGQVSWASFLGN